jgi:hypothetical protein
LSQKNNQELVTAIGVEAFKYNATLTNVTMGNNITSIRTCAFLRCGSLTNITLPNTLVTIGIQAFWSCSNLRSITLPSSVTNIGIAAFEDCADRFQDAEGRQNPFPDPLPILRRTQLLRTILQPAQKRLTWVKNACTRPASACVVVKCRYKINALYFYAAFQHFIHTLRG